MYYDYIWISFVVIVCLSSCTYPTPCSLLLLDSSRFRKVWKEPPSPWSKSDVIAAEATANEVWTEPAQLSQLRLSLSSADAFNLHLQMQTVESTKIGTVVAQSWHSWGTIVWGTLIINGIKMRAAYGASSTAIAADWALIELHTYIHSWPALQLLRGSEGDS